LGVGYEKGASVRSHPVWKTVPDFKQSQCKRCDEIAAMAQEGHRDCRF
jgi:hypothetical protein